MVSMIRELDLGMLCKCCIRDGRESEGKSNTWPKRVLGSPDYRGTGGRKTGECGFVNWGKGKGRCGKRYGRGRSRLEYYRTPPPQTRQAETRLSYAATTAKSESA